MKSSSKRPLWSWIFIGGLGLLVVVFLGSMLFRMLYPPVSVLVNEEDPRSVIQVDVVNASGRKGAGRHVLSFLRSRGFDVVEISSTSEHVKQSQILDRLGDRVSARKVAMAMGIADSCIITEIDSMLFVRATVRIGEDLDNLEPFSD